MLNTDTGEMEQDMKSSNEPFTTSDSVDSVREKVGFLSLSAELRNKIMDLALVPGDIYSRLTLTAHPSVTTGQASTGTFFRSNPLNRLWWGPTTLSWEYMTQGTSYMA